MVIPLDDVTPSVSSTDIDARLVQRPEDPTLTSPWDAVVDEHLDGTPHEHPARDDDRLAKSRPKTAGDSPRDDFTESHQDDDGDRGDGQSYPSGSQLFPSPTLCSRERMFEVSMDRLLDLTRRAWLCQMENEDRKSVV